MTTLQIKHARAGKHADGGGLWLVKRPDGGSQWVQRITVHGRRREMGLGSALDVSLKEARELSAQVRALVRLGEDPIKVRKARRREAAKTEQTLAQVAQACFEARKPHLKNAGKAARWMGPLENHILPKLGRIPVNNLDQNDVKAALDPIWQVKPVIAQTALERLGIVFHHAAAMGLSVDTQITTKARAILGKQAHTTRHTPALPWQEVPAFFASLVELSPVHLALRFLILTAGRSAEVRQLHLDEIEDGLWIVPAHRMKGGKEHRVPLSAQSLQVLEAARAFQINGHPFIGNKEQPLSDMTLSMFMKRRGMEARPHGFRTSFRTWCAEATETPRKVAEAALAHLTGGKVERAYRRTDYLEARRELMARWGNFVTGGTASPCQI